MSLQTPVAYWDLDNDSNDDSGNGNNGTDHSMSYDGTKATLASSNPSYISGLSVAAGNVHTFSIWLKLTGSINYVIAGITGTGGYLLYTDGSNLYYNRGSGDFVSVAYSFDSAEHNYIVTRNSATVKFYIGGAQVGTTQTLSNGSPTFSLASLGGYSDASFPMNGTLRCGGVWTEILGSSDIATLSSSPHKFADLSASKPLFRQSALTGLGSGGPFFGDPLATNELRQQLGEKLCYDKRRKLFLPLSLGT